MQLVVLIPSCRSNLQLMAKSDAWQKCISLQINTQYCDGTSSDLKSIWMCQSARTLNRIQTCTESCFIHRLQISAKKLRTVECYHVTHTDKQYWTCRGNCSKIDFSCVIPESTMCILILFSILDDSTMLRWVGLPTFLRISQYLLLWATMLWRVQCFMCICTNQPKKLTKGGVLCKCKTSSLAWSDHSCVQNA
jgi:hypothetical protein